MRILSVRLFVKRVDCDKTEKKICLFYFHTVTLNGVIALILRFFHRFR